MSGLVTMMRLLMSGCFSSSLSIHSPSISVPMKALMASASVCAQTISTSSPSSKTVSRLGTHILPSWTMREATMSRLRNSLISFRLRPQIWAFCTRRYIL